MNRLFVVEFDWYKGHGFGLVFAKDEKEAVEVAERESKTRFGVRKCFAKDFKVIGELKKSAFFSWADFICWELGDNEYVKVKK
jgi:hypothetical protein